MQPRHFVGVALDRVGDLFDGVVGEVVVLTEHRSEPPIWNIIHSRHL